MSESEADRAPEGGSSAAQKPAQYEHRWPVLVITTVALCLYLVLPDSITFFPTWVVPVVGAITIIPLILMNPTRLDSETTWSRRVGIGFAVGLALVNQVYIVFIILQLVDGSADGPSVLLTTFEIWIINVVAFALVYWQLDLGGPVQRRVEGPADTAQQDFRFPQQDNSQNIGPWHAEFFDYAYFSLTNMMAFSPTDVMPLTRRAKALMAYQGLTGFVLLALVISRSVNILT